MLVVTDGPDQRNRGAISYASKAEADYIITNRDQVGRTPDDLKSELLGDNDVEMLDHTQPSPPLSASSGSVPWARMLKHPGVIALTINHLCCTVDRKSTRLNSSH